MWLTSLMLIEISQLFYHSIRANTSTMYLKSLYPSPATWEFHTNEMELRVFTRISLVSPCLYQSHITLLLTHTPAWTTSGSSANLLSPSVLSSVWLQDHIHVWCELFSVAGNWGWADHHSGSRLEALSVQALPSYPQWPVYCRPLPPGGNQVRK